jgi:hypothetical protein
MYVSTPSLDAGVDALALIRAQLRNSPPPSIRRVLTHGVTSLRDRVLAGRAIGRSCADIKRGGGGSAQQSHVVFVQRYARARLIETVIESPVDEAIAVYRAIAGDNAEDILTVCRAAFQALGGYGHYEAAIHWAALFWSACLTIRSSVFISMP